MEQEIFELGDIVYLKSNNSVVFTVADISDNGDLAQCYYIHDNQPKFEWIPVVVLKHLPNNPTPEPEF